MGYLDKGARARSRLARHARALWLCVLLACSVGAIGGASASAASYGVSTWGSEAGKLGGAASGSRYVPVLIPRLEGVVAVASGGEHGLALLSNGTVMAWGQFTIGGYPVPQPVSGLSGVVAIAAGASDDLALLEDGTVMAWGSNDVGQLGDGTRSSSAVPVPVSGISTAVAIATGSSFNMALLENGTVVAWGANGSEQLGVAGLYEPELCFGNNEGCSSVPVLVNGLSGVRSIAAGGAHAVAVLENGSAMAWGENARGQLGNGTESRSSAVPAPVSGLSDVRQVAAGREQDLALLDDGTVMSWGGNESGQLGNETLVNSPIPSPVSGLSEVAALAGGGEQSLALLSNGTVMAWGDNQWGALGTEIGVLGVNVTPVLTQKCALSEVVAIAAGESDSFAIGVPGTACALPPVVRGLNRAYGPTAGGTEVTIEGSDLSQARAVDFGVTSATSFTVGVEPERQITAIAPPGTGTVDVTVTGPAGTSLTRASDQFTYLPRPMVTGVTPSHGTPYGVTSVTITGTGFTDVSAVRFGGVEAAVPFTVNSSTSITAIAPQEGSGTVDVTVTTGGGTSETGPADQFSYVQTAPEPVIKRLSPKTAPAAGGTPVTITGSNFSEAAAVEFGNKKANFTVNSPTSITAIAPAAEPGLERVTVMTVNGRSPNKQPADHFHYQAPTITSISPDSGPMAGGTEVTITGTGFALYEAKFTFGTVAVTATDCSLTTCTMLTPAQPGAGAVHVRAIAFDGERSRKTPTGDVYTFH
jgi:alpha-tubulin suppressor-like RCC1 family protein